MAIPDPAYESYDDLHSAPTQPLDRADLALALAVQYLHLAYDEVQRAMRYRHELDVALYFEPARIWAVAQALNQEISSDH